MPVTRNMRALTWAEAQAALAHGECVTSDDLGKGWYVYQTPTGYRYVHNPYHGSFPSGRDHEFRKTASDEKARWFVVKVS